MGGLRGVLGGERPSAGPCGALDDRHRPAEAWCVSPCGRCGRSGCSQQEGAPGEARRPTKSVANVVPISTVAADTKPPITLPPQYEPRVADDPATACTAFHRHREIRTQ